MSDKPLNFTVTYPPDVVMVSRSGDRAMTEDEIVTRYGSAVDALAARNEWIKVAGVSTYVEVLTRAVLEVENR